LYDNEAFSDASLAIINKWLPKDSRGYIIIDVWGGATRNQPSTGSNAFVHRSQQYGIEFVSEWDKGTCTTCLDWISSFFNEMLAQYKKEYTTVKAYQNYIDRTLPNWSSAYYADAWPRLVNIKKSVDPSNIFRNPQSIPVAI
jgi:FAD/FMN-containing dehydrogenase